MVLSPEILKGLFGFRPLFGFYVPFTLVYGRNNTGKTYFCCSASKVPELCPVCLISLDITDWTLMGKEDIDPSQITIVDPREHMRKANIADPWEASKQVISKLLKVSPSPFKSFILDGVSLLEHWAEQRAVEQTPFHKNPDGTDKASVLLELVQQGDYRLAKSRMLTLLMDIFDYCLKERVTLFATAQERYQRVQPEGESNPSEDQNLPSLITLALPPSLQQDVQSMFTVVGRMRATATSFVMETRRSEFRDGKDQTGRLGESIDKPTVTEVLRKLREGKK